MITGVTLGARAAMMLMMGLKSPQPYLFEALTLTRYQVPPVIPLVVEKLDASEETEKPTKSLHTLAIGSPESHYRLYESI